MTIDTRTTRGVDDTRLLPPGGGSRPVLEVDQVTKVYPSEPPVLALWDVSFIVTGGELVGILGPSGSGQDHALAPNGQPPNGQP